MTSGISLNYGAILLMMLGTQWYVLFNVIAGASAVPSDLKEAMDNLGVRGLERWRRLILPGIFPAYVTGAITAAGGAWNATIVAEIVTYNHRTLAASGLGAFIAQNTDRPPRAIRRPAGHGPVRHRAERAAVATAVQAGRDEVRARMSRQLDAGASSARAAPRR